MRQIVRLSVLIPLLMASAMGCAANRASARAENGPKTPAAVVASLVEGNARYSTGRAAHPNQTQARRDAVAGAQHPVATVISCCDSRVPVEQVFDQGVGDLFVVRVIGNVADTDEIGSVEYGAGHLKTPVIVVLGHTKCGAVTAAVKGAEVGGSIPAVLAKITPAARQAKLEKNLSGDALVSRAIELNVWRQVENLLARSGEVRELVEGGKVQVVGAVYDLQTGTVRFLGNHPNQHAIVARGQNPRQSLDLLYGGGAKTGQEASASVAEHGH